MCFLTQRSENEKQTMARGPKLTTSINKNTYVGSVLNSFTQCKNAGSKINIKEHSKQVCTTQWSEKWKKCAFAHLRKQDHKYPRQRFTHQNTRFHWFLKSHDNWPLFPYLALGTGKVSVTSLGRPIRPALISGFRSMKRLGVFILPPWMGC